MIASAQRDMLFAAYDLSGASGSFICACEAVQTRSVARKRSVRFISLRINSPISPFNPGLNSAGDVDDVAEAGELKQLRRQRAVGIAVAIHEHGLVLIRQELRQLPLGRLERDRQRSRDVPLRPAIPPRGTDVEDDDLPRVEDHFIRDRRRHLGEAAGGGGDADGLTSEKQKAEGRRQKAEVRSCLSPRALSYFCLLPSAFCLHKTSKENCACTSPTTVPLRFRSSHCLYGNS